MADNSKYSFPNGGGREGLDSLQIKQAIVDSFIPSELNSLERQATNINFLSNIARTLATSRLRPFRQKEGDEISYEDAFRDQSANSGRNSPENTPNQTGLSDENAGLLANTNIIPNLTLRSNYTPIDFFKGRGDDTEEIVIDVPLCSMSYSYSNKYAESTPIGYNGTIKELVGTSNLNITIEGVFIAKYLGNSSEFAQKNMPNMRNFELMCMRNKIVDIDSKFLAENSVLLNYFKSCVVKNFSLPQDNKRKNIQRFTLTLESNIPLNITE